VDEAQTQKCVLPCTPLAVVKALEHLHAYDPSLPEGNRLRGKKVTVINRSEVVGRPLAAMLANDGAQVWCGLVHVHQAARPKCADTSAA
jgi:methylenetetrahydrofolate dehydrogenase (NAD+)